MTSAAAEIALNARAEVGEGAVWCERRQKVWWVDIARKKVNAFHPASGENQFWDVGEMVGCLALTEGDELVLGLQSGLAVFSPGDGGVRPPVPLEPDIPGNRANDGAVSRVLGGLHVANGLAFSPDNRTAYLSDSWPEVQTVWAFDYDAESGALAGRRVFFDARETAGRPDGACVDADGCYWMAGVGGGEILRITPGGRVDRRIALPVSRPSKPCFGGERMETLFVTSIGRGAKSGEPDGALLAIHGAGAGLPEGRLPKFALENLTPPPP